MKASFAVRAAGIAALVVATWAGWAGWAAWNAGSKAAKVVGAINRSNEYAHALAYATEERARELADADSKVRRYKDELEMFHKEQVSRIAPMQDRIRAAKSEVVAARADLLAVGAVNPANYAEHLRNMVAVYERENRDLDEVVEEGAATEKRLQEAVDAAEAYRSARIAFWAAKPPEVVARNIVGIGSNGEPAADH